jgi:hypothetical protein
VAATYHVADYYYEDSRMLFSGHKSSSNTPAFGAMKKEDF